MQSRQQNRERFPEKFGDGVYILDTSEKIEKALKWLDIKDVWGIGRRLSVKMNDAGVHKAWGFASETRNVGSQDHGNPRCKND